jgi:hypothetical protein
MEKRRGLIEKLSEMLRGLKEALELKSNNSRK